MTRNEKGTRASLVIRLADRADADAWSEFLQIYEPMLLRLASRWGMQNADAHEVVQETLLAVATSVEQFEPHHQFGAFRAWLAKITRNKLADHLSRRSKQERGSGDTEVHLWLAQRATETTPESVWDWQQKREIFKWAAQKVRRQVSDQTWQAFYRTSVGGEPIRDVAESLKIREGMVYVARSRVMARLRLAVETWTRDQWEPDHAV